MTTEADLMLLASTERPPCGYSRHGRRGDADGAVWLVTYQNPRHGTCTTYTNVFFCASCWRFRAAAPSVQCETCNLREIDSWEAIVEVKRIQR